MNTRLRAIRCQNVTLLSACAHESARKRTIHTKRATSENFRKFPLDFCTFFSGGGGQVAQDRLPQATWKTIETFILSAMSQ